MSKIAFTILFSVFLFAATASEDLACSCELQKEIPIRKQGKNAFKNSLTVFVGEVSEIVTDLNVYFVTVKFNVEKSWNKQIQKIITISTGRGEGDCGYKFVVGKRYLVYAYGDETLSTNVCSRTALAEENKDIAILSKIYKTQAISSPK